MSLFDGMSCGQSEMGIKSYASEIKTNVKVTQEFPNVQLGNVDTGIQFN